jgi:hypothetical protein
VHDLTWFRLLYVACIIGLSVQTAAGARGSADHHFWLAVVEILGALLLAWRRTQMAGLVVLLGVYAIATIITLHAGHLPLYLILYAGAAVAIARDGGC